MGSRITFGNLNEAPLTQKVVLDAKQTYTAYPIKGGNSILLIQNDYANVEVYINGTSDFDTATQLSLTLRGKKWTFENLDGNLRIYDNFYIWTIGTSEIDIILEVSQDAPNIDYYLGNSTISESLITSVSQNAQNNITNAIEQTRQDFEIDGLLNIENLNVFISGHNTALQTYLSELKALEDELQQAYTNIENYFISLGSPTNYQFTLPSSNLETQKPAITFNKYLFTTTDYTNYRCPPMLAILTEWYQYWAGFTETGNITFTYNTTERKYWYNHRAQINTGYASPCVLWTPNPVWCISLYNGDEQILKDKNQTDWLNETLAPLNATLDPEHPNYARPVPELLQLIDAKQAEINKVSINNGEFVLKKRVYSNAVYIDLNLDITMTTPVKIGTDPETNLQYSAMYALAKIRNISEYDLLLEGKTLLSGNLQNLNTTANASKIGFSKIAIELLDEENYNVASAMINDLNQTEFPSISQLRKNSIEYNASTTTTPNIKNILDGVDITGDLINLNNLHNRPLSENTLTRTIKSGNEIGLLFSFEAFGDKVSTLLQELRTININGGLSLKNKGVYKHRQTLDNSVNKNKND